MSMKSSLITTAPTIPLELGKNPPVPYNQDDLASLRKSAEEFESLFTEIMLKSMRSSVQKSKLIDGGNGEEIFTSMLDSEYARQMASLRQTGLADAIEKQLLGIYDQELAAIQKNTGLKIYEQSGSKQVQDNDSE